MTRWFFRLSLIASLFVVVVVMLGAWTRLVDAGLGCPDWPGCYGFLTVPDTPEKIALAEARFPDAPVEVEKGWPEMIHRYAASMLGFIILCLSAMAIVLHRRSKSHTGQLPTAQDRNAPPSEGVPAMEEGGNRLRAGMTAGAHAPIPLKLTLGLLVLVICQGLFGMWTVTLKLWPQVVSAHLLGGFATLSLLFLLVLRQTVWQPLHDAGLQGQMWRARAMINVGLVLVIGQIFLGAWTAANYAALACGSDFPGCQGQLWPNMDVQQGFDFTQTIGPNYLGGLFDNEARVAIQMAHRVGALILTVYLIGVFLWLQGHAASKMVRRSALVILVVLASQVTLGIANVLWLVPLNIAIAHNAVGALLLVSMVNLRYQLARIPCDNKKEVLHESTQPAT